MVTMRPASGSAFGVECRNPAQTRGAMLDRDRPSLELTESRARARLRVPEQTGTGS